MKVTLPKADCSFDFVTGMLFVAHSDRISWWGKQLTCLQQFKYEGQNSGNTESLSVCFICFCLTWTLCVAQYFVVCHLYRDTQYKHAGCALWNNHGLFPGSWTLVSTSPLRGTAWEWDPALFTTLSREITWKFKMNWRHERGRRYRDVICRCWR